LIARTRSDKREGTRKKMNKRIDKSEGMRRTRNKRRGKSGETREGMRRDEEIME